jgi:uncharacterized protein
MAAFHEGELALQARTGVQERLAEVGARFLREQMPEQHREFFGQLPFLLAASVDGGGQPLAAVLAGPPGFASSPDPCTLDIQAWPAAGDPLASALRKGAPVGLLGIEPHTRRRNRLNGHVAKVHAHGFQVHVDQSFGNCPKYIQAREAVFDGKAPAAGAIDDLRVLDPRARHLVAGADTFFIATAHPQALASHSAEHGVDISHRGGRPGFVRVADSGGALLVPDFTGNSFFNTLGNLLLEDRCALLFLDFESGDTLHIVARARVIDDGGELRSFRGALRLLALEVVSARRVAHALPLRWTIAQPSPFLAGTGHW